MKTKKIVSIITIMFLAFNLYGCTSEGKSDNKKDDYTSGTTTHPTETTTTEEITTTEEPTTENKHYGSFTTTKDFFSDYFEIYLDYQDIQDIVVKNFDGKEFHNGDITDVKSEVLSLGYDLAEYGKVFSAMYDIVAAMDGFKFEIIERYYGSCFYPVIDENTNFVFKCVNETPFKILITTEEDSIIHFEGL